MQCGNEQSVYSELINRENTKISMKNRKKWILTGVVAVAAIVGAYFVFNQAKPTEYLTELVRKGEIVQTVEATGEVTAGQLVKVGAQASGQIKKLYIEVGQEVKQGDMIAQIDSTTQHNDLETKKAQLNTLRAQLRSRQVALEIAKKKYNREMALLAENATSKELAETAKDNLASAQAAVAETQSSIKQTQIAVNTAEVNLGYTTIVAPFSGTVVSVPVEEGQTVNANQTTPTIAEIADLSKMKIKIQIAEGDITKVTAGMPVVYTILSEPDVKFNTTLNSIDPGLTTLSEGSYDGSSNSNNAVYYYGTLLVDNDTGKLHIGMTTQNTIMVQEAKGVLIVPMVAIKNQKGKKMVSVLGPDNQVQEREIQTGLSDGLNVAVLKGLGDGEKVVVATSGTGSNDAGAMRSPVRVRM